MMDKQYLKIELGFGKANSDMDDASSSNLKALKKAGNNAVKEYKDDIDRLLNLIV